MLINFISLIFTFSNIIQLNCIFLPNSIKDLIKNYSFSEIQDLMKKGSMNGYLNYSEFESLLPIIKNEFSEIASVEEIGETIERRKIYAILIGKYLNNTGILFTGMHHSREPISFLMNLNILMKILFDYTKNSPSIIELISSRNIYFIPVVNIDGFIQNTINFDKTGNFSNIRKNRRVSSEFDHCSYSKKGVDINRNYDYKFGNDDIGSDSDYCKEAYRGIKAFSEPETQSIKRFVESHSKIKIAFNYHSYGNILIIPFSFDNSNNTLLKNNFSIHYQLYQEFWNEGSFPKNNFMGNGRSSILEYPANGEASDWMLGVHNILSFSPELGIDGDKILFDKFYPSIDNAYKIIKANFISAFYGIQRAGYYLKIQPIKLVYIDCITNSLLSHQKIQIKSEKKINCNENLYEFTTSIGIRNLGLSDLVSNFTLRINFVYQNLEYLIIYSNRYDDKGTLKNLIDFEKNFTLDAKKNHLNYSTQITDIKSSSYITLDIKFYISKGFFSSEDFFINITSDSNNTSSEYIFNQPHLSLSKKDFNFIYLKDTNKPTPEDNDIFIIFYVFIGFVVVILIMFFFTLKKVRDFFQISQQEEINNIDHNSHLRSVNNPVRFSPVYSDFELIPTSFDNQSYIQNKSIKTETELNIIN